MATEVSTAKTTYQEWQPQLRAVGTLRAARGADLALDIAGLVTHVNVQSGDEVKQGQVLLTQAFDQGLDSAHTDPQPLGGRFVGDLRTAYPKADKAL